MALKQYGFMERILSKCSVVKYFSTFILAEVLCTDIASKSGTHDEETVGEAGLDNSNASCL
jgi:hypothetical protein